MFSFKNKLYVTNFWPPCYCRTPVDTDSPTSEVSDPLESHELLEAHKVADNSKAPRLTSPPSNNICAPAVTSEPAIIGIPTPINGKPMANVHNGLEADGQFTIVFIYYIILFIWKHLSASVLSMNTSQRSIYLDDELAVLANS